MEKGFAFELIWNPELFRRDYTRIRFGTSAEGADDQLVAAAGDHFRFLDRRSLVRLAITMPIARIFRALPAGGDDFHLG